MVCHIARYKIKQCAETTPDRVRRELRRCCYSSSLLGYCTTLWHGAGCTSSSCAGLDDDIVHHGVLCVRWFRLHFGRWLFIIDWLADFAILWFCNCLTIICTIPLKSSLDRSIAFKFTGQIIIAHLTFGEPTLGRPLRGLDLISNWTGYYETS